MKSPKITFIGAGSTIFVKNILGDVFHKPAFKGAQIALMDIDEIRLEESHLVVSKLMESSGATGTITCHLKPKKKHCKAQTLSLSHSKSVGMSHAL